MRGWMDDGWMDGLVMPVALDILDSTASVNGLLSAITWANADCQMDPKDIAKPLI